jgi:cytochrome c oxidase cbb3-type subunit IV
MTMDLDAIVGSISTVVAFLTFGGIVVWAWAGRRNAAFADAAAAPFVIADEDGVVRQPERTS